MSRRGEPSRGFETQRWHGSKRSSLRICLSVGVLLLAVSFLLGPAQPVPIALDLVPARFFGELCETNPAWKTTWVVISAILSPNTLRVIAGVLLIACLVVPRREGAPREALRLPTVVWSVMLLVASVLPLAIKVFVDRPRPGLAAVYAFGSAYPSSHAAAITAAVIGAWLVVAPLFRVHPWLVWAAVALVWLVSFARMALAVHYVTDLVGGMGLSLTFLSIALMVITAVEKRSAASA